jgi:peptidoglycan/LPS O-acetylase OafA/YrhL
VTAGAVDPGRSSMRGRAPELDGLRGAAILLVMANNFYDGPAGGGLDYALYHVFKSGWIGVDLFFVLSGFLITGILCDTRDSPRYFRTFYARRVLRIFPLYYGFLILWTLLLAWSPAFTAAERQGWQSNQWWYWLYLANLHLGAVSGATPGEPTVFWSLAVEEQFYLIWPLLIWLVSRDRLPAVCLVLMVCALLLRVGWHAAAPAIGSPDTLYFLTPARMDALAAGALLAVLVRDPGRWRLLARRAGPLAAALSTLLLAWLVWTRGLRKDDPLMQTVGYTLVAVTAGSWLLFSVRAPAASAWKRVIAHPVLRFFGWYSYGIYVWHELVYHLSRGFPWVLDPPRWRGTAVPGSLAVWVLLTGVTTGLAVLSWHGYERHFLRLKSRFEYSGDVRLSPRPALDSPPPLPAPEPDR